MTTVERSGSRRVEDMSFRDTRSMTEEGVVREAIEITMHVERRRCVWRSLASCAGQKVVHVSMKGYLSCFQTIVAGGSRWTNRTFVTTPPLVRHATRPPSKAGLLRRLAFQPPFSQPLEAVSLVSTSMCSLKLASNDEDQHRWLAVARAPLPRILIRRFVHVFLPVHSGIDSWTLSIT